MKLSTLALATSFLLAGYAQGQTPAQSQTPAQAPSAQAPASSSGSHPHLSKACKKEVKDLCGRAHGQEMQDCVKSGLDMSKFSADCKTELQAAKPKS